MPAIDFPSSPTNGQVFGSFTYDSSLPGWRSTPDLASGLPAGTIVQWPGATAPANWLICNGSAVSRSTYSSLFSAIGTQYGAGDGSTTFNLPDLRGKVSVGLDSAQTEFNTLGETGGAKTHTLTASELPTHSHPNTLTNATVASSTHTHGSSTMLAGAYVGYWAARTSINWTATNSGGFTAPGANTTNSNQGTAIFGNTDTPSATTTVGITNANNTGGDGAHNNLQPYVVLNYIIKISAGISAGDSELATRVGAVELNKAPTANPTFTGTVVLPSTTSIGNVSSTELGYLDGVTSALQTQLNGKASSSHSHTATDITSGALSAAFGGTGVTNGTGLVPLIPTSVNVTSGSASTSATGRVTFSGTGLIRLNGIFTSTYKSYYIRMVITTGVNDYIGWRFCSGGSGTTGASYSGGMAYIQTTTLGLAYNQQNAAFAQIGYASNAGQFNHYELHVFNPNDGYGSTTALTGYGNTKLWGGHSWYSTGNFDGIHFGTNGGGTVSGYITAYGYRD